MGRGIEWEGELNGKGSLREGNEKGRRTSHHWKLDN